MKVFNGLLIAFFIFPGIYLGQKNSSISQDNTAEYPFGYSGLSTYLRNHIVVPDKIKNGSVGGKIYARFIVNEDGSIGEVTILKGINSCEECSIEIIRLIKNMPAWKPAKKGGKAVNSVINLPFVFHPGSSKLIVPSSSDYEISNILISPMDEEESLKLYQSGVQAFGIGQYKKADSLFTQSINIKPTADNYFNRAACKNKVGNKKGFCEDLSEASQFGDSEASFLFCKNCGKIIDTIYYKSGAVKTDKINADYVEISYVSEFTAPFSVKVLTEKKNIEIINIMSKAIEKQESKIAGEKDEKGINLIIEEQAEFPGGTKGLTSFIKKSIQYPIKVKVEKLNDKVFTKFIVDVDGKVNNVEILKGMDDCPECNQEAIRLINSMPNWKPAKMSGKAVKCYFNLPIPFK